MTPLIPQLFRLSAYATLPKRGASPRALQFKTARSIVAIVKRTETGWNVTVLGQGIAILFTPEEAREFAADLISNADVCEGKQW